MLARFSVPYYYISMQYLIRYENKTSGKVRVEKVVGGFNAVRRGEQLVALGYRVTVRRMAD